MDKPRIAVSCPEGLQYLAVLDKIVVKQKKELLEVITGWEQANRYVVLNSFGQQVYFALESSSTLMRQCCGPAREFEMKLTDYSGTEIISMERPFNYCAMYGKCCPSAECCLDVIEIMSPSIGLLGYIRQEASGCSTSFLIQDESETTLLQIHGPGLCCNFSLGTDLEYEICSADGTVKIGTLSKNWSGFLQEYATDADTFAVTFPMDLLVKAKALLLGAVFLIDFMFFEDNQRKSRY